MNTAGPEKRNLCQVLTERDGWPEVAAQLCSPDNDRPEISEERLREILGLVPDECPLQNARYFYPVAYNCRGSKLANPRLIQALDRVGNQDPTLTDFQIARILFRASWRVKPHELRLFSEF